MNFKKFYLFKFLKHYLQYMNCDMCHQLPKVGGDSKKMSRNTLTQNLSFVSSYHHLILMIGMNFLTPEKPGGGPPTRLRGATHPLGGLKYG